MVTTGSSAIISLLSVTSFQDGVLVFVQGKVFRADTHCVLQCAESDLRSDWVVNLGVLAVPLVGATQRKQPRAVLTCLPLWTSRTVESSKDSKGIDFKLNIAGGSWENNKYMKTEMFSL